MPLRLALRLNEPSDDGKITIAVELMAEVISECVIFEESGDRVYSADDILDSDSDLMIPLFKAVTSMFDPGEAEKN